MTWGITHWVWSCGDDRLVMKDIYSEKEQERGEDRQNPERGKWGDNPGR